MHLQIDVEHRGGYTILSPRGEIDFATGPVLKESITDALVGGDVHVVVDLWGVDFIESTGLGALVGSRRRAQALDGSLSLARLDPKVLMVFKITGLDKVFPIFDTLEDATADSPAGDDATWPRPQNVHRRR